MTECFEDNLDIPGGYSAKDLYLVDEDYLELLKKDLWTVKESALFLSHYDPRADDPTYPGAGDRWQFFHLEVEEKLGSVDISS